MTLVEFLTARLDEDEAKAHRARVEGEQWPSARVLADVDAKRRIVDSYRWQIDNADRPFASERIGEARIAEHHVKLLALSYADNPDFREEWKV